MKNKILALAIIGLMMGATNATAQKKVKVEAEIELMSKYIWRGLEEGGVSLQPGLRLSWQNAYIEAFGIKGLDREDDEELDITLGYRFPFGLNIAVTDYWKTGIEPNDLFFEYRTKKQTAHCLEGNLGFSCKYFSLQTYCIFYGHDYKINRDNEGNNQQAYSTYIELGVPFRLGGLDWIAKAAMTPMESAGEEIIENLGYTRNYIYADGLACVLASLRVSKNVPVRNAEIPIYVELSTNPYLKKVHLLGGIAVKF